MRSARPRLSRLFLLCLALLAGGAGCAEAKSGGGDARAPQGYAGEPSSTSHVDAAPGSQASYPVNATSDEPRSASPGTAATSAPPAPPPASSPSSNGASGAAKRSAADASPSTPSPPRDSVAQSERLETKSRPGLGTEFGEARVSRVHDVAFVRDSGRPFAVTSLHYNDRRGVDALVSSAMRRESFRSVPTGGGAVTISVRDSNGEPLEAVHVGDRMFVVGAAGQRYSIVLENHTSHRFEAVGTVDGLDVVNGKPGTFDNRGYVLLPFATVTIDGFRTSTSSVAAFRFAAVADSYAAQTGSARNVGVIGLAFFSERGDSFVPESEVRTRETASPFPADPRFAQPPRR